MDSRSFTAGSGSSSLSVGISQESTGAGVTEEFTHSLYSCSDREWTRSVPPRTGSSYRTLQKSRATSTENVHLPPRRPRATSNLITSKNVSAPTPSVGYHPCLLSLNSAERSIQTIVANGASVIVPGARPYRPRGTEKNGAGIRHSIRWLTPPLPTNS